jgi:hypothetical protein
LVGKRDGEGKEKSLPSDADVYSQKETSGGNKRSACMVYVITACCEQDFGF